jgi:hypothetical protein
MAAPRDLSEALPLAGRVEQADAGTSGPPGTCRRHPNDDDRDERAHLYVPGSDSLIEARSPSA